MTDADAISELVRVGLRNPARVVVKVQAKKSRKGKEVDRSALGEIVEERRIPAKYVIILNTTDTPRFLNFLIYQSAELLYVM